MKDTLEDIENFIIDVILHNKRGFRAWAARCAFSGLSKIYASVVMLRLWLYRERFIHDHHLGVPVISIGNLTVGGTGKTPVVELFARTLRDKGRAVAILSRGYKSKRTVRPPLLKRIAAVFQLIEKPAEPPPRIVSDGKTVLLDSYTAGDEPWMLATNLPGVPVVVDKNRVKAGRHAIDNFHSDVLLLDDGMQYLRLKHRLDIVLVDRTAPFGNGHMLPRGTLREPAQHLKRASYIFITKSDETPNTDLITEIRRYNRDAEIVECRHRPMHFKNMDSGELMGIGELKGKYVGALSGIAVPESFEKGLRKLGAKVEATARFADHHRFTEREIKQFIDRCVRRDLEFIVTTEKDIVRFPNPLPKYDIPIIFMRVEIEILRGQEVFDKLIRLTTEPRAVPPGVLIRNLPAIA